MNTTLSQQIEAIRKARNVYKINSRASNSQIADTDSALNDAMSTLAAINLSDPYKEIERLKSELLERDASWLPAKDAEIERLQNQIVELKKHLSHYADVNQNQ